ncbi:hypothetical protein OH492_10200 [Vibrio chagasii]|nr:hypothetical protein [Vibrio chagasii]
MRQGDNLCRPDGWRKGGLNQLSSKVSSLALGVERAQKARQTIEGNITIEMERLEQEETSS